MALAGVNGAAALLLAWLIVFVINAVTVPFPPAWTVLAAFHTTPQIPLLPHAAAAEPPIASGNRLLFARQVGTFTERLPADARANAQALGECGPLAHALAMAVRRRLLISADPE